MERLIFPVFEVPSLPEKRVSPEVCHILNEELVRRLKVGGMYEKLRDSVIYQMPRVPFHLHQ